MVYTKSISSESITKNDIVTYQPPSWVEPPADLNYSIIYEDQWFLGINKTGNLLVHRSGKSVRSNLMYQLRYEHEPCFKNSHSVNRLDREPSGVVLVAKDKKALRNMHQMWNSGEVKKRYVAVVDGVMKDEKGVIDLPISPMKDGLISYKQCVNKESGKDSVTHYSVLKQIGERQFLVELIPVTGRTHQIRVHLEAIGCPIIGDKLYGMSEYDYLQWRNHNEPTQSVASLFPRQALHCSSLEFYHPFTEKKCEITAELPKDMAALIM